MVATATVTVEKPLLLRAISVANKKSEPETVNLALEEFIERHGAEQVISAFGTVDYDTDYDYKSARR